MRPAEPCIAAPDSSQPLIGYNFLPESVTFLPGESSRVQDEVSRQRTCLPTTAITMASLNSLRPLCGRLSQLSIQPIRTVPFAPVAAPFAAFSTSSMQQAPKFRKQITREKKKQGRALRRRRDQNKQRGVSSIHRSGPKHKISMSNVPLPEPADYKPTVPLDEKHGLWGFFPKPGTLMETPDEMIKHGRAWTVEELRRKSWEDLHGLWWVCCKEKNMLSTAREELKRSKMGFGDQELALREQEASLDYPSDDDAG